MAYRLGILGDTHGNAAGLALCLRLLRERGVDGVVHLGDAVGYMPHAEAVCRMLARYGATCLMGNHEAMLLGQLPLSAEKDEAYRLNGLQGRLPAAWLRGVERSGPMLHMDIAGVRLLLCHGTPDDPLCGYGHGALGIVPPPGVDCVLTAHTHRPHAVRRPGTLLLNPGSCGLPRDNGRLLSLAILELPGMQVEMHRIPFSPSGALLGAVHPSVRQCFDRNEPVAMGGAVEERP